METEVKEKDITYENIRLNKSFDNYAKIIEKKLPYKFSYLDDWLLKSSKLLLNEANKNVAKYRVYKRGTIIKADFGVGIGSEMSQVHFAVVLSKNDNPKNNVLTVLPLTSKSGKHNLYLGTLIIDTLTKKMEDEIKNLYNNKDIENNKTNQEIIDYYSVQIKKMNFILKYYEKNLKASFGCTNLITTISKTRLLKPINEYDIIGKTLCPDEVLNIIDNDIIQKFTKLD